jgi:hypothetical protein
MRREEGMAAVEGRRGLRGRGGGVGRWRRGVEEAPTARRGRAGMWQRARRGAPAQGERRGCGGGEEAGAAQVEEEARSGGGAARARAKIQQPNGGRACNKKMAKSERGFEYIGRRFVGARDTPTRP